MRSDSLPTTSSTETGNIQGRDARPPAHTNSEDALHDDELDELAGGGIWENHNQNASTPPIQAPVPAPAEPLAKPEDALDDVELDELAGGGLWQNHNQNAGNVLTAP